MRLNAYNLLDLCNSLFILGENSLFDTILKSASLFDTEIVFLLYLTQVLNFIPYMTFSSILSLNDTWKDSFAPHVVCVWGAIAHTRSINAKAEAHMHQHIHMHQHTRTHTHTHTHARVHTHTHTHTHARARAHTHAHSHTRSNTHARSTHPHTHTRSSTHAGIT